MSLLLDISDVVKNYAGARGPVPALRGVSLSLGAGEFAAIQGPSGCGKSTLLLAAGTLLEPTSGTVRVAGQNPFALSPEDRAKFRAAHIGFVFQQFHLIPYLSVRENIWAPSLALPTADAQARADELARSFGLQDRLHHVPAQLSTGERQRVALARALINRPRLLLADEPTGNLDAENRRVVLAALADFAREGGAVLLVTHDPEAARAAGRVLGLRAGRFEGP